MSTNTVYELCNPFVMHVCDGSSLILLACMCLVALSPFCQAIAREFPSNSFHMQENGYADKFKQTLELSSFTCKCWL